MMLLDAFAPEGVTRLAVDSIFMMPQLGVLAEVENESARRAAMEVFTKDCLIPLGTCVAARGIGKEGAPCMKVRIGRPAGDSRGMGEQEFELAWGSIRRIPLEASAQAEVEIEPARQADVGAGRGKTLRRKLAGGVVGLIFDARGRPLLLPPDQEARMTRLAGWAQEMDLYPGDPSALGRRP